jgi:GNAT superfamily N-acetyltransferase
MPTSGVRLARTSDVDAIADVNVRCWQARLAGLVPDATLAALDPGDLAMTWASAILNPPHPAQRLLVAVDDDVVVGYAAWGPCADPDVDPGTGELLALEVDPGRCRSGHGSRLMAAAVDLGRTTGTLAAITWIQLADEPRRAFLVDAGWGPDSAYRDVEVGVDDTGGAMLVREVRLVTSLADD